MQNSSSLKAEEKHKRTTGQAAFRLFEVWFRFAWYAFKRHWWIVMVLGVFGGVRGYLTSLATTNRYEVRAAFLMPTDMALPEYERLMSRKLVASSVSKFKVSRWIDRGSRGLYEMYSESPFVIKPISIAAGLKDTPLAFRFVSAQEYEIQIKTPEGTKSFQGKIGEVARLGTMVLEVDLVRPLDERMMTSQYYISFNTDEAIVNRFLFNLEVIHLFEHPNRIALHYTDEHPDLAFDMLDAFTHAYLENYREQRVELYAERLREVDAEMRILEAQIMATPNPEPYLQSLVEAGSKLPTFDSSAYRMLQVRLEQQSIRDRLAGWGRFQMGTVTWDSLRTDFAQRRRQTYDTIFDRADDPDVLKDGLGLRIALVDTMILRDRNRLAELQERSLDANAELLAASAFQRNWEKNWIMSKTNPNGVWLALREKYLSTLNETARLELEMRKENLGPQLIDPPYHVPTHGRDLRLRVLAASVLGMFLLGLALAIAWAYSRKRFQAAIHFIAVAADFEDHIWKFATDTLARRRQVVDLELSMGEGCQRIALVGIADHTAQLGTELALSLGSYGKRIAILRAQGEADESTAHLYFPPKGAGDGWWLSGGSTAMLQDLSTKYDRILLCLPSPDEVPEVLGVLRTVDARYFVVKKQQTSAKEWRAWQTIMKDWGLDFHVIWID
jgi:hypothetical protein